MTLDPAELKKYLDQLGEEERTLVQLAEEVRAAGVTLPMMRQRAAILRSFLEEVAPDQVPKREDQDAD